MKRRSGVTYMACEALYDTCRRACAWLIFALALLFTTGSALGQGFQAAVDKLRSNEDFRLRVQAALELGKTKNPNARPPLERALDDRKPAVRAAAAAALKALGDRRALPALKQHLSDPSPLVRSQIEASVRALEASAQPEKSSARLLVKIGSMKNGTSVKTGAWVGRMEQASRDRLGRMPGVQVVDETEDVNTAAKRRRLPAVMVTGRLRRLSAAREGGEIVYSASVDYVVHRMPEQSILSALSGSASAKATPVEAKNERRIAELRNLVLEAAVDSAMRRAPEALEAAMK
jgi:hypothetical protein